MEGLPEGFRCRVRHFVRGRDAGQLAGQPDSMLRGFITKNEKSREKEIMHTREELLWEQLAQIEPISKEHAAQCLAYWDTVGKPLRSLGKLEDAVIQIGGIQRSAKPSAK